MLDQFKMLISINDQEKFVSGFGFTCTIFASIAFVWSSVSFRLYDGAFMHIMQMMLNLLDGLKSVEKYCMHSCEQGKVIVKLKSKGL